jgi:prolyl-tRNA editing enzyme YbaK/EbsC (Cys-tRNA(Pro) deacylase)
VSRSIRRFEEAASARGLPLEIRRFPEGTRTAPDAARAVGCDVGQIVKSLVFIADGAPVVCLCAGDRRVDAGRLGSDARPATAAEAREATGFAIGGVPPLGHERDLRTVVDVSLRRFGTVWCAAGTPHAVFAVQTDALLAAIQGAEVADVAA